MKIKFVGKEKVKKLVGCVLVSSLMAAPVAGLAQNYTIQPGDNLMSISQTFYGRSDYYDEIAYLNNISDPSMIRAGDVIYLPNDFRELEFCGQDDKWMEGDVLYYTFGPNDTLWALASKFYGDGMYWKPLAVYNGISDPKKIKDGKVIQIPPFSYLNHDAVNWDFDYEEAEAKVRRIAFKEDDTLWAIASKNYGSGNYWEALAIYNNISNPRKIQNGTIIELPQKSVLKEIQEGNYARDLYTISKETYGSSKYAGVIAAINGISNFGTFNPKDLHLPSLDDINVYYESDTFTYPKDGYYVVRKGDTLRSISELVYEDPTYGDLIKEVNGFDKLVPGATIYIPEVETYTK